MGLLEDIHISSIEKIDLLINSNYQVPLIIFAYLYFVLNLGPRFMKNRQPYSLKTFMKIYNILQIVGNARLIYDTCQVSLLMTQIFCPKSTDVSDITAAKVYSDSRYYLLLKIFDYVETGIFILRKKDSQVSILHLYHHVSTLFVTWLCVRYYTMAPLMIIAALNCFVHVLMYTYYYLAAFGPNVQKQIAHMKRWVTIMQMVQFCIMILYMSQNFLPACKNIPHGFAIFYISNVLMNFRMFYNFYQETYVKPKRKSL